MIAHNGTRSQKFRKTVLAWHKAYAPPMPWRETRDPWHILVSEVMLQQTQIPRVRDVYTTFMNRFPTPHHMARTPLRTVLSAWQGIGYNRRAKYLKDAAVRIMRNHGGAVPNEENALRTLPGIGPYSACAIMCFAHGTCKPFVETNIRRAIIHEFFCNKTHVDDKDILRVLERIQPRRNSRMWYLALMDYGRDALKHIPNPNRRSKHYSRQSKFEGSARYVRAQIVRLILRHRKMNYGALVNLLKEDDHIRVFSHKDIGIILDKLVSDGMLERKQNTYTIRR